tara:strand:+ start:130 stop:465 length:336 start_codon:yes stop_codon:yes gene_type:complete
VTSNYEQQDIFSQNSLEETAPFQRHSFTSKQAADQIQESAKTLRAKLFRFIKSRGQYGCTDEEAQTSLPMLPSTQRPRRVELANLGLIKKNGQTRKTKSNRNAAVWIASDL